MKKFISLAIALAMVLSIVPALAATENDSGTVVLFDIAQQDITADDGDATALNNFGWTASGDATQGNQSNLRLSLHWTNDGEIGGSDKKALTVFDSANDSTDRTVVASIDSANDTVGAEKIIIEYSWGIRSSKSDNYQSWAFIDLDGNVIAKTYIDAGNATNENGGNAQFKLGKDENHVVVSQGSGSRDKVLALRALPFKIESVKQSDDTYVTTYYYDDNNDGEYTELYSENVGAINGFKAVSTWIGGWSSQWACMGLMDLKISYTVESAAEVTVKTVLSDGTDSGIADSVKIVRAGAEYEQPVPSNKVLNVNGVYYIYNEETSTRTITPVAGGVNTIMLVYDKFEGTGLTGDVISEEGATCWFADPRSLTVKNDEDGVNVTYVGYIDVHGSVKAAQYDNKTGKFDEVLVRSNFQPDDHNNPTFLELPDHRIMIFYSRHTDEACFYYRVSKKPYDITTFGEEKYLKTSNNTTYPNPFILSDDPDHIYLGWRGINWHPTLGRLTMPDENGDVTLELEKQIVQSTGARPYAKYTSNGKDEIWVTYTTGHPDNEDPNWLYFNRINVNTLDVMDVNGNILSNINNGTLAVAKNDASKAFAVDAPSGGTRDWVWEIANDNGKPVIAMVKISSDKKSHDYWYATYDGSAWVLTDLPDDPTQNTTMHTSNTEYCYSGGMSIDKADPHIVYVSMPVNGVFGKVFEIVKFTLNDDYTAVVDTEYITENSRENNVRPYVANGSAEGDLRLTWMNGYYQYWMVRDSYPQGFPTRMMTSFDIPEAELVNELGAGDGAVYAIDGSTVSAAAPANGAFTISMELLQSDLSVGGTLLKSGDLEIDLEKSTVDPYHDYAAVAPKVTAGGKTQKSDNLFSNSDWFTSVSGTNGDKGVNSMGWINYTVTYDGKDLVTYVNGLIDANLQDVDVTLGEDIELGGIKGIIANIRTADAALSQAEVKASLDDFDESSIKTIDTISISDNITADLILPTKAYNNSDITWESGEPGVIDNTGAVTRDAETHKVTLTATVDGESKDFTVTVAAKKDVSENLVFKYNFSETYDRDGVTMVKDASGNGLDAEVHGTAANLENGKLDLTANTADGWTTNGYMNVPYDVLKGVRSYTVVQQVKGGSSVHPRLYDMGTDSQHSVFTRADAFSAGIKNSTTQLVNASVTPVPADKESWIVTSYNAATKETKIYLDGVLVANDSTAITHEPYQVSGGTARNYIGRTQWWAADNNSTAQDNQDFNGTIDNFMFFNAALTEEEIAELTTVSVAAEANLVIKDNKLGLAYTAAISGNADLASGAGFEYAAYEADENGNYVVLAEELKDESCETVPENGTLRLTINGISNANSARIYAVKPYVVVDGAKVYGETVTATLYDKLIDSIVNGQGSSIPEARLTAANSIITFVKENRKDNSEAKFPGLAESTAKLYNDDGTMIEKAVKLGISDTAANVLEIDPYAVELVEIDFADESIDGGEIITDLTMELDFVEKI